MNLKVCLVAAVLGVASAGPLPQPDDAPSAYGPYSAPHPEEPSYEPPSSYPARYQEEPSYAPHPQTYEEDPPKPYAFEYGVNDGYSGANYGHNENSDGQEVVGSYQVDLPDGRTQIVSYKADHYNGFQAQVEYKGEAQYPETQEYQPGYPAPSYPAPAPSYPAPSPSYSPQEPVYDAPVQSYPEEPAPVEYN
ncbi:adhesive plaque matrix protein-like [Homarus americanus]|uniref:adhesive plaque matrix protein-like n=1 Tax=Homarus americanus TaxID=6706 RepID=UPI001C48899C|nr:adhesive plaque matrix protein-like [Homarus americanus]